MSEITDEMVARMVMLEPAYTNAEIADKLGISESTVSKYLTQYREKARAADDYDRVFWETVLAEPFGEVFQKEIARRLSQ